MITTIDYGMDARLYHDHSAISKSDLDLIDISPAHFMAKRLRRKSSPALVTGSLMHTAILEPEKLDHVVKPDDMSFATKEGKAWRDENAGKMILTGFEAHQMEGMMKSVQRNLSAARLLKNGKAEVSLFVEDGQGNVRKSRIDWIPDTGNMLVDLKTCDRADADNFEKSIQKYRYHVQAAYYLDNARLAGLERDVFLIIAVEKEPPYACKVYQLDDGAIEVGRMLYKANLQNWRNCRDTNSWPAYGDHIETIGLPEWAMAQAEAVLS